MGLLDDAIRDHLELKKRHGASQDEVTKLEGEVFGPEGAPPAPQPEVAELPPPPAPEPRDATVEYDVEAALDEPATEVHTPEAPDPAPPADVREAEPLAPRREPEPWLDDPDEVPAEESLEHPPPPPTESEDVLEATPEFLQETPDHDRLWFEQKPPRDFDFDG